MMFTPATLLPAPVLAPITYNLPGNSPPAIFWFNATHGVGMGAANGESFHFRHSSKACDRDMMSGSDKHFMSWRLCPAAMWSAESFPTNGSYRLTDMAILSR